MPSVGTRLKKLRNKINKTQADVAKDLGLQRITYAQYEIDRREADYDTLQKLADYYDTTVDYLLGRTDDPTPVEKIENVPPLLEDLDPTLVKKFLEAMQDPLEELFFDDILSATKEEREELIREFLIMRKERKKHLNKRKEQK